jgi:hypothetical protein
MKNNILFTLIALCISLLSACGGRSASGSDGINPRDTVTVPEGITGEDSIAYIENAVLKDHITMSDFLALAEVHELEDRLFLYHDSLATPRDKAAMRLANRFMRMHYVAISGDANSKLQWAMAVNAVLDTFGVAVPSVPKDSALYEIIRVADEYSSETQSEMNFQCYIHSSVDYYRTIEAYRQWIEAVPADIRTMVQEEYEAWHDLNSARFTLWDEVSYSQEWYSMKPMEIEGYRENLSSNRRAELEVEREIILNGKPYQQKGKTVTAKEWEQWIADSSVPEDIDDLKKMGETDRIPSDSLVADRVNTLKSSFARWLKARQALAEALPKERGDSYDFLTADIHSRMIGKLQDIIPYENR